MKKLMSAIAATAVAASLALSTTVASAETYYTAPDDPSEWTTWFSGSPALSEITQVSAESTADGMRVWFPETAEEKFKIVSFLIANGAGITEIQPTDELHIDVTLEGADKGTDIRWTLQLAFNGAGTGNMYMSKYIAAEAGYEANEYNQMPQGRYEVVIPIGEMIEQYDADNSTTNYDKIWNSGADNTRLLTGLIVQVAASDPVNNSDKDQALVIHDISFGTAGSTASTASTGSTASTASTASKSSTTGGSSKTQVGTGENMLPIIGIAALAVVATSAVVVTKKRAK